MHNATVKTFKIDDHFCSTLINPSELQQVVSHQANDLHVHIFNLRLVATHRQHKQS